MVTQVKNTAWSLGLYTLFAAGKTLLNMPWHKSAPQVHPVPEEPKAPVLGRKVSVLKTGAQVGGGALLLGAAAALEGGGSALSTIARAVHSTAGFVFENFTLATQLAAAFALGYLAQRYLRPKGNPAVENHIHIVVNGGDVNSVVQYGKRAAPLTEKQMAIRRLFQRLVHKTVERERTKAEAREAMEILHYRRLLKQLEN